MSSNEPVHDPGDGNRGPDWRIVGELAVKVRAEREGGGDGRIYTLEVGCTNLSGNGSAETAAVTVPHDRRRGEK